ncbi:deaminase [Pseudomonas moorei]|uniref:deaminase n=1 Tax=Pseudomonas moorei TaxID=395599 RepID=UPI001FF63355|nr:deaminase [Pseudomonas moorei]
MIDEVDLGADGVVPTMEPAPPSGGDPLGPFWNAALRDVATVQTSPLLSSMAERHTIYSGALAAILVDYWNGNKLGPTGSYFDRASQLLHPPSAGTNDGVYAPVERQYLGHNIAAFAVDGRGEVIDFEFNHNELFNSSAEHAEARLVRRVFSLGQIYDNWQMKNPATAAPYSTILSDVTIYTSLESCAQCSGIMNLGLVKAVVYLQHDPGQRSIGNILWNLWGKSQGPQPIAASAFAFPTFAALDSAYKAFQAQVGPNSSPFWTPAKAGGKPSTSASITSFLCTDTALAIFKSTATTFESMQLTYPDWQPKDGTLTNKQALEHVRSFRTYASMSGRRGTPHGG